jgi:hypothetical protein
VLSGGEAGVHGCVVRLGGVASGSRVVTDGWQWPFNERVDLGHVLVKSVADEHLVDQFPVPLVDAAVSLTGWQQRGEVPQSGAVALVGAVGAGGAELGPAGTIEDLAGRGVPPDLPRQRAALASRSDALEPTLVSSLLTVTSGVHAVHTLRCGFANAGRNADLSAPERSSSLPPEAATKRRDEVVC